MTLAIYTGFPYCSLVAERFAPAKDAINRIKHWLSLGFGDALFVDENHLVIPSLRLRDGEERFKVIGMVSGKLYTAVFVWREDVPRFISVRRSNHGEGRAYHAAG